LEASKEHLREARKRLQEGLSELNANANSPTAESRDRQIQTEDVSRPLVTAGVTSLPPSERDFPLVKREIPSPNLPESQPTPIAASTLESFDTDNNNFVRPIPIPVPTPESALPKAIAPRPGAKTDGSDPLPSPEPIAQPPAESLTLSAFNQPIPISVPTPVSPEAVRDSQPPSLPVLDRETARDSLPEGAISYQVRHGDTLNDIARRYGISVTELARTNHIGNPNRIEVSQSLVIPFPSSRVQSVPPRPQSTESLPLPRLIEEKADGRISPVAMNPLAENRPVSPAVDAAPTEKLKAEIDNLEATYGQPLVGDPSSVGGPSPDLQEPAQTPDGASLKSEPAVNPEWQSDRPGLASENSPTQEVAFKPREEQIVGAAPSDAQNYNDSLRLPVGYEVSPELPPLSSPENYLPDTPVKFTGYIWPAKGVLTSGYGRRWGRMHRGIDIAAPIGTPIVAAAPGEVIFAGWNAGGYGNLVKVRHDDGSVTFYAHNSRIFVRLGQKVNQGEPISAMGSTGYSTGPHLHFEIRPNGKSAANPIAYLPSSRN
jgi:murein DD-endopeptidase MepM/ murein hydrolase activator NlpD